MNSWIQQQRTTRIYPIERNAEFERIYSLPRRTWTKELGEEYSKRLTPLLATSEGLRAGVKLLPLQALGLWEAHQVRGGFFAFPVGAGKTLTAWLLPYVLQSKRPLYLNVAALESDRDYDFALLKKHWVTHRPEMRRETYSQLYQDGSWDLLSRYEPDLILADEGDLLRNTDSSATMRIDEYMLHHPKGKTCMVVILTGTPIRKSLKNIAHLLRWTHKDLSPLPKRYVDLENWANAIDEKFDDLVRRPPGALLLFANDEDRKIAQNELDLARLGIQRRLIETPGYICSDEQSCDTSIHIRVLQAPPDPILDEHFRVFRTKETTPDGWELEGPLEMFNVGHQLGCGFFTKPEPRPPYEWSKKRQAWFSYCRSKIGTRSKTGKLLATELMVAKEYAENELHQEWLAIKPTFRENRVAQWLSGSVLGYAKQWLQHNAPAMCWVIHIPVGEALSRMTGIPFFGAGGKNAEGTHIIKHSPTKPAICTIHANKRGRNLQGYTRHLVIGWPQPATDVEQLLGRSHRRGQMHPVHIDVLAACAEHFYALDQCYREASFVKMTGGQTQKILLANIDTSHVSQSLGFRWSKDPALWAA
jgi:hypothetical protein